MVEFIDINEQKRTAKTLFIIEYEGSDFIEAVFESRNTDSNRTWFEYYPLLNFQNLNPEIVLYRKRNN